MNKRQRKKRKSLISRIENKYVLNNAILTIQNAILAAQKMAMITMPMPKCKCEEVGIVPEPSYDSHILNVNCEMFKDIGEGRVNLLLDGVEYDNV